MKVWGLLLLAITSEVIGTSALKSTEGFTRLWPSLVVIAGYSSAFYFLSLTLREMPIGIAYAVWSGVGVALITLIGWVVFGQTLNWQALVGIGMIVVGVIVLNVWGGARDLEASAVDDGVGSESLEDSL